VYLAHPQGDVFGKEIYSSIYGVLRGWREGRTGEAHASWRGQETRRGPRAAWVSGSTTLDSAALLGDEAKLEGTEEETGWTRRWMRKIEEGRRASTGRGGGYCSISDE
jgi:hypothetical protein